MGCIVAENSQIHSVEMKGEKTGKFFVGHQKCQPQAGENVRKLMIQPSQQDIDLLDKALSEHYYFYRLPKCERSKFIEKMGIFQCDKQTIIFKQGDLASLCFFIIQGQVQIIEDSHDAENKKKQAKILLTKGACFGQLALLYTAQRSATAKALTRCQFFCVSHSAFRKTVQQISRKNYEIAKSFIYKTSIFAYLSKYEKNAIAYNTLLLRFQKDQVIFKEGQKANQFYIVTSGKVQLQIRGKQPIVMRTGDSFGESALSDNHQRLATAKSMQKSSLLSISRESLINCLGSELKQISFYNILKWSFSENVYLKTFTNTQKQKLINLAELQQYKDEEIICMEGEKIEGLVFVLEAKVNNKGIGEIFHIEEYLGNREEDIDIFSKEKLIKNGSGFVALIRFQHIDLILSRKNYKSVKQVLNNETQEQKKQRIDKIKIPQLYVSYKINDKQLYKIYNVSDNTQINYLIKCISKKAAIEKGRQMYMERQKQIINQLNNKFIPKLLKIEEDPEFVYFISEFCEGVVFQETLAEIKACTSKKAQFFTANLVLMIEYFHQNGLIWRDLKPQNLMLDTSGYLAIIDLGIAKKLTQDTGFRTFTLVGTPHYMAPEIFSIEGYTFSADLWSLGVILYQMIFGELPFGNQSDDPYETIKEIMKKNVDVTKCNDQICKQLLLKLLNKNPGERFAQGVGKLKTHNFFNGFDWEGLQKKKLQVPYKITPKKRKPINKKLHRYLRENDQQNINPKK